MNQALSTLETSNLSETAQTHLHLCAKGSELRVVDLDDQPLFGLQDHKVSLRLKELGFLPGAAITVLGFGLLGRDPVAIRVNGTKFALRRAEAAKVRVEVVA